MTKRIDWLLTFNDKGELSIHPELLAIKQFSKIWNKKDKDLAVKELAYIGYRCNYNSPYNQTVDTLEEKLRLLGNDIMDNPNYIPPDYVEDAIKIYMERNVTFSMSYLEAMREAARKIITYYKDIDFTEQTKSGALVNKPADVIRSISSGTDMLAAISKWEDKVKQEEALADAKITGGGTVGDFED